MIENTISTDSFSSQAEFSTNEKSYIQKLSRTMKLYSAISKVTIRYLWQIEATPLFR